jgi:hypothetical protein
LIDPPDLRVVLFNFLLAAYLVDVVCRKKAVPFRRPLVALVLIQALLVAVWSNDYALQLAFAFDGGATLPYSRLWFLLNPFWMTTHVFLVFLLGVQMASLGLLLLLARRKVVTVRYVYWTQVLNAFFVLIHGPQSVVPMQFVWLVPLSVWFLVPAVLVKLPFFWSWDWSDSHAACLLGRIDPQYGGGYVTPCAHLIVPGGWSVTASFNFFDYAVIVVSVCFCVAAWRKKRKNGKSRFP